MAGKINLDIVAPDKSFFSGEVDMLVIRATDGDMAVLYNHEPYVTPLSIGPLKIINEGEKKLGAVAGGFLHVDKDKVTVITESVEWADEIDAERAEAAKHRAEERLKKSLDEIDVQRAEYALKKAINRLRVSGDTKN